jgi:hypothetical protein
MERWRACAGSGRRRRCQLLGRGLLLVHAGASCCCVLETLTSARQAAGHGTPRQRAVAMGW